MITRQTQVLPISVLFPSVRYRASFSGLVVLSSQYVICKHWAFFFFAFAFYRADLNRTWFLERDFTKDRENTTNLAVYEGVLNKYIHGELVSDAKAYTHFQTLSLKVYQEDFFKH